MNKFREFIEIPVSEKLKEEQVELNALIQNITDTNTTQERRNQLINELQREYPFFLENISAETASNEQLKTRLAEVNELYIKRIALQSQQERIEKALKNAGDARLNQFDREKERRIELNQLISEFKLPLDLTKLDGLDKQTAAVANELLKLFKIGEESARTGARAINGNIQAFDAYNKIIGQTLATRGAANVVDKTRDEVAAAQEDLKALEKDLGSTLDEINSLFSGTKKSNNTSSTTTNADTKKSKTPKAKREPKSKIPIEGTINDINIFDPAILQLGLELKFKYLEEAAIKEQNLLKESLLQGKITQEEYNLETLRITQAGLATKIELLDIFNQKETNKRVELNIELLETEKALITERALQIAELENSLLNDLEQKFLDRLITEEEYNLSRLRVQMNFYDQQLRLLEENGAKEEDVYRQIQEEKLKIQKDYNAQKVKNEERTQQIREQLQRDGFAVAKDMFTLGSELLSLDEKQRKKNASAIKKFETAAVIVNSLAEISEISRQYAKLGPIGTLIGIGKSIAVGVRAGIAIAKINAQQFYRGGEIKEVSGQLITERPNINPLPGGDNVLIAAKPGEIVLNENQKSNLKQIAGNDIFGRIGVPGFAGGGVIPSIPSTTPTISSRTLSGGGGSMDKMMQSIMMAVENMTQAVAGLPSAIAKMDLKTHVVYTDMQKVENNVNEIKKLSGY